MRQRQSKILYLATSASDEQKSLAAQPVDQRNPQQRRQQVRKPNRDACAAI